MALVLELVVDDVLDLRQNGRDYFQQPALLKRFVKRSFNLWSVDYKQVSDAERERLVANTAYFAAGEPDKFAQIKGILRQAITEARMDSEPDGGS